MTFTLGIISLFLASWGQAGVNVSSRSLTNVHYMIVIFHVSLLCLLGGFSASLYRFMTKGAFFPTFTTLKPYFYLAGGALFDTLSAASCTVAFQSDSAGFVSLLGYVAVVWAFTIDFIVFSSVISGV
jgi:hypothetical protein